MLSTLFQFLTFLYRKVSHIWNNSPDFLTALMDVIKHLMLCNIITFTNKSNPLLHHESYLSHVWCIVQLSTFKYGEIMWIMQRQIVGADNKVSVRRSSFQVHWFPIMEIGWSHDHPIFIMGMIKTAKIASLYWNKLPVSIVYLFYQMLYQKLYILNMVMLTLQSRIYVIM